MANTLLSPSGMNLKSSLTRLLEVNYLRLMLLHILLGITSIATSLILVVLVYTLLLAFLAASQKDKHRMLPYLLIYLVPIEVFGRMINASPFLPWEMDKYLGILLFMYGIMSNRKKSGGLVGLLIFLLLIPGILIAVVKSGNLFQMLTYNVFGMINLSLAIIYFANRSLSKEDVAGVFRFFILGATPVLVYIAILAPSFANVDFDLNANFQLTGGFGSNQVSTILGLAGGLGIWLWLLRIRLTRLVTLNFIISALFMAWSLLSFSRGGVLAPIIALLLVVLFVKKGVLPFSVRRISPTLIIGLVVLMPALFYTVNQITGNKLLLRYLGETNTTLSGTREKDLNVLTTGRSEIALSDLEIWSDHFVFGAGVGESSLLRDSPSLQNVSAHVEISRLLSEHGLLGFIISLLFLFTPVYIFLSRRSSFDRAFVLFCFTVAILTSMHSATRTFVTPLFYGMAFVKIKV